SRVLVPAVTVIREHVIQFAPESLRHYSSGQACLKAALRKHRVDVLSVLAEVAIVGSLVNAHRVEEDVRTSGVDAGFPSLVVAWVQGEVALLVNREVSEQRVAV